MAKQERQFSIDIFRGLVIVLMVFVNYQQWMKGSPAILQHAAAGVDSITLADVVFPFFIFAVGLCIPLALENRMARGFGMAQQLLDIAKRGALLIFLGVVTGIWMSNYGEKHALLNHYHWSSLFYTAIFLSLPRWKGRLNIVFKSIAGVIVLFCIATFRDKTGAWNLDTGWWGILGMIGWTYAFCALIYLWVRTRTAVWYGLIALAALYYNAVIHWTFPLAQNPEGFLKHGDIFGSHTIITIAGIVAGIGIYKERFSYKAMTLFAAVLLAVGHLLRALNGANKIDGTDAYCMLTAGMALVTFMAIKLSCDRLKLTEQSLLVLIGKNALAVYFLQSFLWVAINSVGLRTLFWPLWPTGGAGGMMNVVLMLALTVTIGVGMTKRNIRLNA